MPSKIERELTDKLYREESIAKRLGQPACKGGLIDPSGINKGYCQYMGAFCNKARICETRKQYQEKQKYKP